MRPLALVSVAFIATASFNISPGPGLSGRGLAMSAALVIFSVGTLTMTRARCAGIEWQVPLILVVVVSAVALMYLQPSGPGFLGVFPAVAGAALRLPGRWAGSVLAATMITLAVGWSTGGNHPLTGLVFNEIGVAAFFLVATFARRLREANAQSVALIAELEESRAALAEAAALGERQRLAREMHDVLAHSLSGLVINLEGARLLAERDGANADVNVALRRAHQLAKSGLDEAKRAIGMLRDDALPGPQGMVDLAAQFEADTGVPCTFQSIGDERGIGEQRQLTLYRVTQEALTNIRKHACPSHVAVDLDYEPSGVRLAVEDFGTRRRSDEAGAAPGYGLTGMRERAELAGGSLTAGATESGFRVELWLPG
jgi:signal transduction histidine kinase